MSSRATESGRASNAGWRDGGRLLVTLRSYVESARSSLFAIPVVWIVGAIGLSQLATWIDRRNLEDDALPDFLDTTVESARAILGAISSGTITAASVVFSLTLVAIQMSTSVYTSRVLRSFLRDRFQQNMIGILLATFTYSLLVLREVRGPLDSEGSEAYIPRLSVFLAVLFAIAAVIALLASISHTSHSLRATAVTRELVTELVALIERTFHEPEDGSDGEAGGHPSATGSATDVKTATSGGRSTAGPEADVGERHDAHGAVLTSDRRGWVQQISLEALREAISSGTSVRLEVSAGRYVGVGAPLLVVWPPPQSDGLEDMMGQLRGAFAIGEQRSLQQDVGFGLTMIEDIANKALSPGVNDPNTASAVIEQLGEVVLAVLEREPHPATMTVDGCQFTRSSVATHDEMVVAAFNQIRHFAIGQPAVQLVLVRTLVKIGAELIRRRRDSQSALDALRSMLRYVEADLASPSSDPAALAARDVLESVTWYDSAAGRLGAETTIAGRTSSG